MKRVGIAAAAVAAIAAAVMYSRRNSAPEAPAARVVRTTLVQVLTTNGKVEALRSTAVPVRTAVTVREVLVREGDPVRPGQALASVDETPARAAVERAKAQLEIARAGRAAIERGGAAAALAELDAAIAKLRLEREASQREAAALRRLVERQAATRAELADEEARFARLSVELEGLEKKRKALVAPEDRQRVEAQVRDAEIALAQAEAALRQMEIRSPAAGTVYALRLKPGAFYSAGEVAAEVGRLDRVRVRVLVDEPELGSVAVGQPVEIRWDAFPGQVWTGSVERLPSQIEVVGTRNVGEVRCTVDNPGRRLIPNVTVNASIETARAVNTLAVPREAVIREGRETFVLVAESGIATRRAVKLGIQDPTRVEVLEGLTEQQLVLLPGGFAVRPGDRVEPKAGL